MHTTITTRNAIASPPPAKEQRRRPVAVVFWVAVLTIFAVLFGLGIKYHAQIKNLADMYRTHSCHTPLQPQQRVDASQWSSISQLEAAITQLQAHQHELTAELSRLHELVEENKQREDPRIKAQVELVQVTLEKQINLVADRAFATEHELTTRMDALEERVMSLQTPRSRSTKAQLKDLLVSKSPPEIQQPPRKYLGPDGTIVSANQL